MVFLAVAGSAFLLLSGIFFSCAILGKKLDWEDELDLEEQEKYVKEVYKERKEKETEVTK